MWTLDDVITMGVHDLTRNAIHPRTGQPLDVERMIENRIASWLEYGAASRRSGSRSARMTDALTGTGLRSIDESTVVIDRLSNGPLDGGSNG